jgi:hypothetical protein
MSAFFFAVSYKVKNISYLLRPRKDFLRYVGPRDRVTRLGEFSPIRRLFTLGSFLKKYKRKLIFGLLNTAEKLCINFDKKWVGLHFGRFFRNHIWSPWPCHRNIFHGTRFHHCAKQFRGTFLNLFKNLNFASSALALSM